MCLLLVHNNITEVQACQPYLQSLTNNVKDYFLEYFFLNFATRPSLVSIRPLPV